MNRKILTRLLSVLLVVVMTFGLLPVSASAAWWNRGDTAETQPAETADRPVVDTQAATDNSNFIRAFHLDCGRRYFSVDNIKTIIDNLKKNNYTHLELAFGNDALRFLLEKGKTYTFRYANARGEAAEVTAEVGDGPVTVTGYME